MLHPDARRFLGLMARAGAAGPATSDAAMRRDSLRSLAELTGTGSHAEIGAEALVYADAAAGPGHAPRLDLRLYRPAAGGGRGLVLYVHGGGWVAGDLDTHDGVCRALAASSGCAVLAIDYRRPPEHPYPAAVLDVADVAAWCAHRAEALGFDADKLALAGDSAGAHIACAAAFGLEGRVRLAQLVLLCPILDPEGAHPSRQAFAEGYFISPDQLARDFEAYAGGAADLASPLGRADLSGLPPTLLHLAEYDPFRDEGLAFEARLKAAGVSASATVYPGMIHYFYALPRVIGPAGPILAGVGAQIAAALT